ncbi:MAG: NAD(P)-binding protein, partial [Ramlibacter sp.]
MTPELLVAGGGIGGLAAALAATRAGCTVRVFEQAAEFAEIGAGIQLGPNATRLLHGWGLEPALAQVAAAPQRLVVRRVGDGARLAVLPLGAAFA